MPDIVFKPGRNSPHFTPDSIRKAVLLGAQLDALGRPPLNSDDYVTAVNNAVGGADKWGMDGNDEWGDCTCADASHQHMLWTANTGAIEVPSAEQTLALYSAIAGFNPNAGAPGSNPTDQGAMIADVCHYIENGGYMGNRLQGFADVSPLMVDHVRWGVQLFGSVKLGINLPQSAMEQFNSGQGWKWTGDTRILGGHDVACIGYVRHVWYIVTWGRVITMGPMFFNAYVEEVKVPLALNWCRQGNLAPNKLNLQQLQAELSWEGTVS